MAFTFKQLECIDHLFGPTVNRSTISTTSSTCDRFNSVGFSTGGGGRTSTSQSSKGIILRGKTKHGNHRNKDQNYDP
ncbi:hypothetical protein WICPIJ_000747 [Wickerhamomyces pijperi]|uniref:Uncharacterized protein n=1 Tax=Wickerhamomyces pijperi TaxID=599730 RepID=A0A9P8TRC4_WICPI|nr:hypothetical protein WICPIJ_000747 [Wickerhamomyces pijperi]